MKCLVLFLILCSSLVAKQNRESSFPYLSGDTFRAYADFIIDETTQDFSFENVQSGDVIFVKTDYLELFFQEHHPRIAEPYVLITHNSDRAIPGPFVSMLDDEKLLAWFGQNVEKCSHPKLHPIPIGIANKSWRHGNTEIFDIVSSKRAGIPKKHFLYLNFTIGTFVNERSLVYNLFKDKPYCTLSSPKHLKAYLLDLALSKFVLSPRGNGLDCHRTWEALYMGAIPIVSSSSSDSMYEGLPVLIIEHWEDLNFDRLQQKYKEMQQETYDMERLFAPYWLERIEKERKR